MFNIPLFDSLMHPMPNGGWLSTKYGNDNFIEAQIKSMFENNIKWGLAVGLGPSIGNYNEDQYADYIIQNSRNIYPVAFLNFAYLEQAADIEPYLIRLKKIGYIAIKIHPRISNIAYTHSLLPEIITIANQLGLGVLLCTYFWSNCNGYGENGLDGLMSLLTKVSTQKIILLHGGAVRLLEVAEMVRQFPNMLLDLSFTLCKYEGSSIDLDIEFLFKTFDKRICVGSDSPEFTHFNFRNRFESFSAKLDISKSKNIAYQNLISHLCIHNQHEVTN